MVKFTPVEKSTLMEKIGILQPSTKEYSQEDVRSFANFSDVLKKLIDDPTLEEVLKDKVRDVLYTDIIDPMAALENLLEYSTSNKGTSNSVLTEDFKVNDVSVGIDSIDLTNTNKTTLTGDAAIEAARASLGIREPKKIVLYRSGFWIAIGKISTADIIDLENAISNVATELRESMLGLEYTTDMYIYLEIIMDFIERHLIGSSLDVPSSALRKHILVSDVEMLYGGVIDAIEPRGFLNYFKCSNALKVDVTKVSTNPIVSDSSVEDMSGMKVTCGLTFSAKLHARSLLRVAEHKLTSIQRVQLLQSDASLTLSDIKNYQDAFTNSSVSKEVTDDEINFKFTINVTNVDAIINSGKLWNDSITLAVNNMPLGSDVKIKNNTYKKYYLNQALAVFAPYITRITLSNNITIENNSDIMRILADTTDNDVLSQGISKEISKYIDDTLIAIFGVPDFICDSCNGVHNEGKTFPDFRGFIPINLRKYFFTLLTLRG